jgi:hypothetical protein
MTEATTDPVTRFLDAVARGSGIPADIYAPGAVLDATVPNWRFEVHHPAAISTQLSGSYAHPGHLFDVARTPLPGGEAVRFTLAWTQDGDPMAAHQVHLFDVRHGAITSHDLWCGGQWDAALQAEIEAELQSAREEL